MGIFDIALIDEKEKNKVLDLDIWGGFDPSKWATPEPDKPIIPEALKGPETTPNFDIALKAPSTAEISQKQDILLKFEDNFQLLDSAIEKDYKQYQEYAKQLDQLQSDIEEAPDELIWNLQLKYNKIKDLHNELVDKLQTNTAQQKQIYQEYNTLRAGYDKDIDTYNKWANAKNKEPKGIDTLSIAEQLKAKTYIPGVGEEIKRGSALSGTVATFGMMLTKIPKQVAVGVLQATQGKEGASVVNRDWADEYIKSANEDIEGFVKEAKSKYGDKSFMGLKISDLAELPQNMGYSLTSMAGGLAVGIPLSLVPLPGFRVAAYTLGTVASGKVAYNATTYQIMQQYLDLKNEESISNTGKGITQEEEDKLKKDFNKLASQYGLWEAIPEAISNLAFIGLLTAPLTKMIGNTMAGQIITKLTGMYGEELLTETITQMGQAGIEAKVGIRGEEEARLWTSPQDWVKSLKEVAPQTFLLTTLMAGAGSTVIKAKEVFGKAEDSLKNEVGEKHPLYNKLIEGLKIQLEDLGFMPREGQTVLAYKTEDKEPWQMTKGEYEEYSKTPEGEKALTREFEMPGVPKPMKRVPFHTYWVNEAIEQGKTIPAEVLADYPDLKQLSETEKPTIKGIDFEENPEVYRAVAKVDEIIENSKLNIDTPLNEIDVAIKGLVDSMQDKTLTEEQTKLINDELEKITIIRKDIEGKPTELPEIKEGEAKQLLEEEKLTIRGIDYKTNPEVYRVVAKADDIIEQSKLKIKYPLEEIDIAIKELKDVMLDKTLNTKDKKQVARELIELKETQRQIKTKPAEFTEIEVGEAKQLPEGEKGVPSKALKNEYLKIIGKDIKLAKDRLELLKDIRKDIPISEELQIKYPNLMDKISEAKFAEIEVSPAKQLKEGEKPVIEAFEETSKFLYNKPFKELNKSELNKVLETSKQALPDETGEYVNKIGTPAKGLELRNTDEAHARFIFGGFEKEILTDSHLLVFDKDVSKAVLGDLIEKYRRERIKAVQSGEISYQEAQKIVDKEIENYKKEFVKNFPDTEKIVSKEAIEEATPLWLQGHKVTDFGLPVTILTDGKIQIALDTNKLSFLNKHFPNAEIKATGVDKPVLFMEGKTLKAVVMPVRVEEYPFKITGEPTIKPTKEITPGAGVKPTIEKISKIKPTAKPTIQPISPEERAERGRLIKKIHTIKSEKGLTGKEYWQIKRRIKAKYNIPWITSAKMNLEQLRDLTKAMERARPRRIGYKDVITLKTENKIQSLKDSLVEKYQMTEEAYQDTLKDLHIYKEPRYIDAKNFITEEQGKELIYRLIDEANILKITEPLRIALEKNPEIKKLADIIDRRVKLEGERTLKDPSDLNSARSYFQILETISGAPFFTLYQDLINCHLENRADLNHLIEGFNEYKDIIKDEKGLKRVEDWILAKSNLQGRPETPADITPKETELAKKIEGILKDYQSRARTEKFLDNLENLKDMPQYIQYKKEIDKAKDIYESKGYDDLVEYMKTQEWGVIKSGYDPLQVVSARIRAYKAKALSLIFGKSHIEIRKDIEYKEQDTNIITRVIAYKRQMDNLSVMASKVRALITLANKNLSKFKNPNRVKSNLQVFFRELKGHDRSTGWFERGINRLYAQAMTTIIMGSPALSFRNIGQNFGLGHDKTMLVDPRNKKLTPDEIVYLDTYVQQAIFMHTDWFMTGEKPLPGLGLLTKIIKKINLYPRSDVANRHWGFWGKINQVRMAFDDKNIDLKKKTEKAKFSDFSLLEQKRALQILAKDGQKAMEKYVAKVYVDDVHFLYETAQRSFAEMGPYGKVFGNLMLFPRAYWEKLSKFSKKMTGKNVPFNERARAFKVISSVLIGGALVSLAYMKTTGRREPPYDPLVLLAYQTGGLMIGTVEALNDVYVETINAVRGDKRALATLTSSVPALADHLIPFYNYALRGYEAFLGDPLVNKNIDVYALKKLRQLVDKEYEIRGGVHSVERNAIEKWQYFLSGAGVDVGIKEREAEIKEKKTIKGTDYYEEYLKPKSYEKDYYDEYLKK